MEETLFTDHELKLTTYARRIRHIKALSIKNVSYKCPDVNQLEIYFTLHPNSTSAEFYKSDAVRGTVNLSWHSIDLRHVTCYYTAPTVVYLRVWVRYGEITPKVHLEYDLDLQNLVLATPQSTVVEASEANGDRAVTDVVTFDMFGAKFVLPPPADPQREYLYLETEQIPKCSYSSNQLARLQTVLRALKQTEQSMVRVKEDINCRMDERKPLTEKQERVESGQVSVAAIKTKLEQKRQILLAKRSRVAVRRSETSRHEKQMEENQKSMQYDDMHYAEVKSDYYSAREKLLKGNALLFQRNKQMIHELCLIYPIEQMVDGRYTIAGVYLPCADQVNSQNELASSTALGYTCHLVSMLYRFLEIPLQFPIEFRGSRSLIYDMARPAPLLPSQKDRSFPLYSRGKDKRLFYYAAQLLNKNVENLRYAYELPTKDPKLTLRSIKDFLHSKFGIGLVTQGQEEESRSPPIPLQRTVSVPGIRHPSLAAIGRAQTLTSGWQSPATDSPTEEYSSDETPAKPATQEPAQGHHYQFDTNLPSIDTPTVNTGNNSDPPELARPPTDTSIPFDGSDTPPLVNFKTADDLALDVSSDGLDSDQQVATEQVPRTDVENTTDAGTSRVGWNERHPSAVEDPQAPLAKSMTSPGNQRMTKQPSVEAEDGAQEVGNSSEVHPELAEAGSAVNGIDKHEGQENGHKENGFDDASSETLTNYNNLPCGAEQEVPVSKATTEDSLNRRSESNRHNNIDSL